MMATSTDAGEKSARLLGEHRPYLFGIAYRLLGSIADAEDLLQDAWLRLRGALERSPDGIEDPRAFLVTVVTRLGIDRLRRAAHTRETYYGPWLPEPLTASRALDDPAASLELEESLSTAFLLLLERLSPQERAVLILRDVFDYEYAEIAAMLELRAAHTRKLNERARNRIRREKRGPAVSGARREQLLTEFMRACRTGSLQALEALLCEDVRLVSDGGGQVAAATRIVYGPRDVARLVLGLTQKGRDAIPVRADINGAPGLLVYGPQGIENVLSFEYAADGIAGIFGVRNPEKLRAPELRPSWALRILARIRARLWPRRPQPAVVPRVTEHGQVRSK